MDNVNLSKTLTNDFNEMARAVRTFEEQVQNDYDYLLAISKDGTPGSETFCDKLKEPDVLELLNGGTGYIRGYHTRGAFATGSDTYKVGTNVIEHDMYGEKSFSELEI